MAKDCVAVGRVEDGKLSVLDPSRMARDLAKLDGEVIVTIQQLMATRSLEQNKLYWKAYVNPIATLTDSPEQTIHRAWKYSFLPQASTERVLLTNLEGEIVLDQTINVEPTTTTLNTAEFSTYLDHCAHWALHALGEILPMEDGGLYFLKQRRAIALAAKAQT